MLSLLKFDLAVVLGVTAFLWLWVWISPVIVVRVRWVPMGALGMALPGVILLRWDVGERVLRHELGHQDQLRRWSPLGIALYLGWYYGKGFLLHRRVDRATFQRLYRANPLEKEACDRMDATTPLPRLWGW